MKRRKWLSTVALATALPGCIGSEFPSNTDGESQPSTPTTSDPGEPETLTGSCEWPDMCEATKLVEVTVWSKFAGDVVLEAGCRNRTSSIEPGNTVSIKRQLDGESCDIRLTIDGEEAFDREVSGSEMIHLTVDQDGELEQSITVL
ncbi:hypothetical protein [Halorientalis sp. IM1011]|uniref:hypothetical protein n=1 Tax=Halorientalis sp. IM1011 TaxID=1932360 RepID=UPI0012F94A36|nr:hypothetical protein [Halorientalis sp. IM1011]